MTDGFDEILDGLFHNADHRIMPTETRVIWLIGTFPGLLGSPLAKPTRHNPDILYSTVGVVSSARSAEPSSGKLLR
jgi:hypothetical protein